MLFWSQFSQKGRHYGPCLKWKTVCFGRNKKGNTGFQKLFLLSKYHMLWCFGWVMNLFSILSDIVCQKKCHFQLKQLCQRSLNWEPYKILADWWDIDKDGFRKNFQHKKRQIPYIIPIHYLEFLIFTVSNYCC